MRYVSLWDARVRRAWPICLMCIVREKEAFCALYPCNYDSGQVGLTSRRKANVLERHACHSICSMLSLVDDGYDTVSSPPHSNQMASAT